MGSKEELEKEFSDKLWIICNQYANYMLEQNSEERQNELVLYGIQKLKFRQFISEIVDERDKLQETLKDVMESIENPQHQTDLRERIEKEVEELTSYVGNMASGHCQVEGTLDEAENELTDFILTLVREEKVKALKELMVKSVEAKYNGTDLQMVGLGHFYNLISELESSGKSK